MFLDVQDISVAYGPVRAVRSLSLRVEEGEVVALLGANGAGKSSTLRAISRLAPVQSGRITFDGRDISGLRPGQVVRLGLAHAPEGRRVFGELTVRENLEMGAYAAPADEVRRGMERVFRYFPVLAERRGQMAATLSGGEQQMLSVGRALMSHPRLLMLDEPSLGLAPQLVDQIFQIITQINRQEGVAILLVEQNANEALLHAHRGYILENGRSALEGPAADLRKDPRVIEAYLGG